MPDDVLRFNSKPRLSRLPHNRGANDIRMTKVQQKMSESVSEV